MNRSKTEAIVLRRTNFSEADKVVSLITKDFGRVAVLARGVRRVKSRMAGGIEPFTISQVEFIRGRGELATLVSARSKNRFEALIKDYDRAALAGELLKVMNDLIEDDVDSSFFELAATLLHSVNDETIEPQVCDVWFRLNLLGLLGRQPDLLKDAKGANLDADKTYHFDPEDGVFFEAKAGRFKQEQIKAWRVLSVKTPLKAKRVTGLAAALEPTIDSLKLFMASNNF